MKQLSWVKKVQIEEKKMIRSPGGPKGLLEIYSHRFKGGKNQHSGEFFSAELAAWVQAQKSTQRVGLN